ncbi:hypothetical protein HC028_01215 [Planosporangium flavigriseum]|uniref:Staphyloferrin B biosynthesis citrate synthase SbnG n=1 Tax=Planosporangium flavigriseum TaxID=373681 RepID=A0A8J3LUG4_9ACTN|nr:aldolase/citrate lyase family protein [Planosporangium flavigriseum]NJC63139.1 hypothetical protein [Planosporangium flavigriseum]GIG76753.1 staphyloferrin B biosynthesis citrate synthase SbnG [Planosporangium flavigriseum]
MPGSLAQRMRDGEILLGSFHALRDPTLIELVAYCGFDFVMIEYEHGVRDVETVQHLIRAAEVGGVEVLVRIAVDDVGLIGRFLDAGASGVMVAHVSDAAAAEAAVRAAMYPPEGSRGLGFGRRQARDGVSRGDWGDPVRLNQDTLVFAIVEDPEGVQNIDSIVRVPGLSGITPGSGDLALSQGLDRAHPTVLGQVDRIYDAVRSKDDQFLMAFLVDDPSAVAHAVSRGATLLLFGLDSMMIPKMYKQLIAAVRDALASPEPA